MKVANYPSWYLNPKYIRQYKNYRWTEEDRKLLYRLRDQEKKSITQIIEIMAKHFNVEITAERLTHTRLHNQIRIARANENNQCCYCNKKLQPEDDEANKKRTLNTCKSCAETSFNKKKSEREAAIAKGLCGACRKRKVLHGFTCCKKCLSYTQRTRMLKMAQEKE